MQIKQFVDWFIVKNVLTHNYKLTPNSDNSGILRNYPDEALLCDCLYCSGVNVQMYKKKKTFTK